MVVSSKIYDGNVNTQTDFAEMWASFLTDGYVANVGGELEVTALTVPVMKVNVASGRARIQGYWYDEDTPYMAMIDTADPTYPRIDRIILLLEIGTPRQISVKTLPGTASATPSAPSLSGIAALSLVQVYVAAGATTITSGNLTDERDDLSVCGIASVSKARFSELMISQDFNLVNHKFTNLPAPVNSTDISRKKYIDDAMTGGVFGTTNVEIAFWPGNAAIPSGWLELDGSSLSTTIYPNIFAAFGYTYGGSGGNFNLPDTRGKSPFGASASLGSTGGEKTHQLIVSETPAHVHTGITSTSVAAVDIGSYSGAYGCIPSGTTAIGSAGGGGAHNNLHPYLTERMIVRAS
jgi:microcystin-dependent protein